MSSLAVTAAQSALTMSASLVGAEAPMGSLQGKSVVHWSYKLFIAGAVVGAIALVAGAVLGALMTPALYALAVVGVILCVTNSYAAVEIKKFGILKSLEESVQALAARIKLLAQELTKFKQENDDLAKLNKSFKEIPGDWEEQIKAGKVEITKKAEELEKAARDISAAQQKLDKFAALTGDIQKATGNLSSVVSDFNTKEHDIDGQVASLKDQLNKLNSDNSRLVEQIHIMDAQTDDFEKAGKQFTGQIEMIGKICAQMKNMNDQLEGKTAQLDKENAVLKKEVEEAQAAAQSVEAIEKKFEDEVIPKMKEQINTLERKYLALKAAKQAHNAVEVPKGQDEQKTAAATKDQNTQNAQKVPKDQKAHKSDGGHKPHQPHKSHDGHKKSSSTSKVEGQKVQKDQQVTSPNTQGS